jgi:hypothetical protein
MLVARTDNFQFRAVWLRESEPLVLEWEWHDQFFRWEGPGYEEPQKGRCPLTQPPRFGTL